MKTEEACREFVQALNLNPEECAVVIQALNEGAVLPIEIIAIVAKHRRISTVELAEGLGNTLGDNYHLVCAWVSAMPNQTSSRNILIDLLSQTS